MAERDGTMAATPESGQVILRISQALARLIRSGISELQAESAVVFDSPADMDSHDQNRLSLFLYQIENNPWQRNQPGTLTRRAGRGGQPASLTRVAPPLPVDLIYMMVPYGKSADMELVLANKLVRLFHDIPTLEGPLLDPALKAAGNECIAIVPEQETLHALRDLWAGFPGKPYKMTKIYRLSPVHLPSDLSAAVDMVGQAQTQTIPTRSNGGQP